MEDGVMIKKHGLTLSIIWACSLILGGCGLLPEPASLIQAPQAIAHGNSEQGFKSVAMKYLPKGAVTAVPNSPVGTNSIIAADFDGDGQEEEVVLYQDKNNREQVGAFVLRKNREDWEKIFAKKGTGYEISWASVDDVTGDGREELLLGWKIGSLAGNVLEIYTWKENKLKIVEKINYHEMEAIQFENEKALRLAIWRKEMDDVYDINLLKWGKDGFESDEVYFSSYFPKVVDYYKQRTEAVPDAAHYWYYLADAQLKANHPGEALLAVNRGMEGNIVVPSFAQFEELRNEIDVNLENEGSDIPYDVKDAGTTLEIPRDLSPYITVEGDNGSSTNYIVSVFYSREVKQKELLFSLEIYSKEMVMPGEVTLEQIAETDQFLYFIRQGSKNERMRNTDEIFEKALVMKDKMISSVKPGNFYPTYKSVEEQQVVEALKEATRKYWYVVRGGEMDEGLIESFTLNDTDYRFMGTDLNSKSKLIEFLSDSYSDDSIQSFIRRAKIIEHKGKLAQPNADGGPLLNYEKAEVVQAKGTSTKKEFDLRVPLGASLSYEYIHIEFQKTDDDWKISSEPGTF